ncbi:putative serine esterase-domain-containing protein [Coniochaeta sp. 2T2.1]|nr:putative serine esterase-domain-containing protein [Coniochaeta sp. 2T2.1]
MAEYTGGSIKAEHLCVLVHGLWGNPAHMKNVARRLRAEYPEDQLYILVAKKNAGSFTYDGIELGGERVCREIEDQLEEIKSKGGNIKKLSIAGYSLGGLVARYAIGLLYSKGVLDELECQNFTAFASPFLGVRSPLRGFANQLFNVLGARTLSKSGHQLFTIDQFRDTGRPLLAVMADPKSVFMQGLAKFKRRTLYTNIVNDRTAVHYTTGIAKRDPYADLTRVKVNYLPGYEPVVLDPSNPVTQLPHEEVKRDFQTRARAYAANLPFVLALSVFLPMGVVAFLITSAIQTVRSSKRIELHEKGLAGIDYRSVPLIIKEIRNQIEDAYEELNNRQHQDYLPASQEVPSDSEDEEDDKEPKREQKQPTVERKPSMRRRRSSAASSASRHLPTLALTEEQFGMIDGLDGLGWRKYPVWIHKVRHSHAAIVVRSDKESFSEGEVVLGHWAKEEFLI